MKQFESANRFKTINSKEIHDLFKTTIIKTKDEYNFFDILNFLSEVKYSKHKSDVLMGIRLIKELLPVFEEQSEYFYLVDSVWGELVSSKQSFKKTEMDLRRLFLKNAHHLIGGDLVAVKNDRRHIPDAWVKIGNEVIPVEIKLKVFNTNALDQLQRYMDFYKCKSGIAVAPLCTCTLPKNIKFISLSFEGGCLCD